MKRNIKQVPASIGYGYGGKGESELMSMLQSYSPELVVVNIDNGFGADIPITVKYNYPE